RPPAFSTSQPQAWLLSLVCSSFQAKVTRVVGRSVTFHLQNLDGNTVVWSFDHDVIASVKFGNPPEAEFFDDKFKPRLAFPKNGSALTISQLEMGDTGTYTAKTTKGAKTTFTLHVYRELVVLTVTCAVQNCSADSCHYALRCTALGSGYGNISYGWSLGGLWSEGPTVLVEESPLDKLPLTCMAQNPVSSLNTTVVSPAALCAGNGCGKVC
ncbi:SLAF5 protein, partial [Alopecoenas beccarii]|nr:SLAF5 protein [Alopecoenas beccarii]